MSEGEPIEGFDSLINVLEESARQGRRIYEAPLALGIVDSLKSLRGEALEGSGWIGAPYKTGPADASFSLEWEGEQTKVRVEEVFGAKFLVCPFGLWVRVEQNPESDWLRFRVSADYAGEVDDKGNAINTDVGVTDQLSLEQLDPILKSQVDAVREASKR